jgi:hypothetical protein
MRGHDIVIASGAAALLEPPLASLAVVGGLMLAVWGLGGWLGRRMAPVSRLLGGMHPAWWGAVLVCLGTASALAGAALLLPTPARAGMLGCSAAALTLAVPSLVAGIVLREADRHVELDGQARPWPLRRLVRVLLTAQFPAGGPVWPPRATELAPKHDAQRERC